jgi:hypothetical protein
MAATIKAMPATIAPSPRSLPPPCSGDLDQEISPSTQPAAFSDRVGAIA